MTILIAGSSWGRGEWNPQTTEVLHTGLEQYLKDAGHHVINISKSGISNLDIVGRTASFFDRFPETDVEKVFVFQTDSAFDVKHHAREYDASVISGQTTLPELAPGTTANEMLSIWLERFYSRLSGVAQKHSVPIYIIGAGCDTVWFDDMNIDYPGCNIACQSVISLLLKKNHRVPDPVFSYLSPVYAVEFLEFYKQHATTNKQLESLIEQIEIGMNRESIFRENPKFFYPDGAHLNRHAHKVLYDFLKEQQLV